MKTSIVPAQITTVEDRIAGSLTWQQLCLLALPFFVSLMIYTVMPRSLRLSLYKLVLMILVALVCGLSAIRFRGRILLAWGLTIIRYNTRPRYYIFNKNDAYLREPLLPVAKETVTSETAPAAETDDRTLLPEISTPEAVKLEAILTNPAANVSFQARKKGGLHVSFTEVE